MKKMNGELMYKRISKYANKSYLDGTSVIDWKYETMEEDKQEYFGLVKLVKLIQIFMSSSGNSFEVKSIIEVPYDGRKEVRLLDFID